MTAEKTISRRALVKAGFGAMAAPAVLRVLPAEAQSQVIKIRSHCQRRHGRPVPEIP